MKISAQSRNLAQIVSFSLRCRCRLQRNGDPRFLPLPLPFTLASRWDKSLPRSRQRPSSSYFPSMVHAKVVAGKTFFFFVVVFFLWELPLTPRCIPLFHGVQHISNNSFSVSLSTMGIIDLNVCVVLVSFSINNVKFSLFLID